MSGARCDDAALFDGPGEMRARCRSTDWSSTPLGPVAEWPAELQMMVRICLDSGFPMSLHWGEKLTVLYNDAFVPVMGSHKHAAALGRPTEEVWAEQWAAVIGPLMQRVIVSGGPVGADDLPLILDRNGYPEECYVTFAYSPIRGADGTVVGVFNTVTETTGKVLAERRLRAVRALGAISATRSGTTADTCRAMLEVLMQVRESVPFALALLREEPGGRLRGVGGFGLVDLSSPALSLHAQREAAAAITRVMTSGKAELLSGLRDRQPQEILPGPIGPLIPDEAMIEPLAVARGADPLGVLVLGISPYRRLNDAYREFLDTIGSQIGVALADTQAFRASRDRVQALADLDLAKMEVFQNVSHELRTPLTLVLAPLQDILDGPEELPTEQRQKIESAVRAAERLSRIVNALLDFARSESGTLLPRRRPVNLSILTADTASMFRSAAEREGVRFLVSVPSSPLIARVDAAMWATIVTNLVSNAVKFTPEGEITIALSANDDEATLTVTDTGVGIAADEQPRVFERFFRSARLGSPGGSGIGLALVFDLVHAHQGTIAVTSSPDAGSIFTVTVPTNGVDADRPSLEPTGAAAIDAPSSTADSSIAASIPDASTTVGPANPERRHAGPVWDRGSPTVLVDQLSVTGQAQQPPTGSRVMIIEDDGDLRNYLKRMLTGDGWQVHALGDAEAALAAVTGENSDVLPDLVLTDVMLPGRSGLELVTQLRANRSTARIPIIVLTARGGGDAAAEGLAAGADDYVTKPFTSRELLARVRTNLELHQQRERAIDDAENRATQVRSGLESNRLIGTAIGLLMAAHRLTAAQGFQLLVKASQDSNSKLRDLAAIVVETGRLPFRPTKNDELLLRTTGPLGRANPGEQVDTGSAG